MKNRPHIMRFALATMLSCFWTVAAFAAPGTVKLDNISVPVLDGATQPSYLTFDNVIPNALADYYTYVPYTTADAIKLGFPNTCGNVAKGDTASTEDCYTITVQSFRQALSLSGIFGGGPGLVGLDGITPLTTKAFGYGSGGPNWTLPYYDTQKPGVVAGTKVTGNAPAGPLAGGIWHFPAPTIKGAFGRPIRVQWLNELPNEAPVGLDPSVDCGTNAPNCFPYNRITTHVHGAHVGPESDGLASAWFTPGFKTVGEDFVSTRQHGPEGTYFYPMDQEAGTIWYHDHAMGTTHNNTNMGMAGFWPITDANEKSLVAANILPTGAYELGFALQDRHFDAATGDMVMPDYPIFNLNSAGCVPDAVTGLATAVNCPNGPVLWMKAKDPNNPLDAVGHFVPYNPADAATLANGLNGAAPYPATSATLEYFGNIPVVNGVVYGKYNVEPRVYRMRFIGGTDSRTWVMKLQYSTTDPATGVTTVNVVPFWQIGTEQGLLNNPVQRQEIDIMGGERIDVLVDFSAVPAGTRVMMKNLGPDTPWPGAFEYQAGLVTPSVDIPEIMAFDVVAMPAGTVDNVIPPSATTNLRPLVAPVPLATALPAALNPTPRVVSLMEITDGYGRTMPTIDSRGFKPIDIPVTEIIKLNDTEQWDIVNTTVDAHPMHLHQVAFKVINRQAIDPAVGGFTPPTDDIVNQVFTPPSYRVAPGSLPIPPDAWDDGWKDTVASPPGYVTRVWAKFDLVGEYVWHCHILSHEEHDMMRNFIVTDAAFSAPAPAKITVPATAAAAAYTVNWVGTAITGVTYELQEATDSAFVNLTTPQPLTAAAPNFTTTKTANGTFYYRVRAIPPTTSGFTTSAWRTATNPVTIQVPLTISATTLAAASVNAPYSSTTASTINGVSPFSWSVTGTLPAGLTFDITTGVISGTPTPAAVTGAASAYAINVTVTDSATPPVSKSAPLSLVVNQVLPAAPTALAATAATPTTVNLSWTDNADNEAGFTVTRTPAFATAVTVAANATTYTDTTAVAGTAYSYSVAATNAIGSSAASTATVTVPALLAITTATLPAATVNAAYTTTVASAGGVGPYTWTATGLPVGLTFDAALLTISGTPALSNVAATAASATFNVNFTVTDTFTPAAPVTKTIGLLVNQVLPAAPTLLTATAFGATQVNLTWVDNALNETGYTLQRATNATFTKGLITFAALPANTTTYSDTTAVAGTTYYYRVASSNIIGLSAYAVSALVKPAALAITAPVLPAGSVNLAYTATVAATGGAAPYTWSATGLPVSLSIAPATGIISGTLTPADVTAGALSQTYNVTITVQDSFVPPTIVTTAVPVALIVNQVLPAAPTLLTQTPFGTNQIDLTWVDNSNNEAGFTLQRATDTKFTLGLTTFALAADTRTYSDTTVLAGTAYYYRIASNNIVGTSKYVVGTPKPARTLALLTIPATTVLPAATVNLAYTATLAAAGGQIPYIWSNATGLPAGLTMTTAGVISGIPAPSNVPTGVPVIFPVTFTVTDSFATAPQTLTAILNLTVNQALPAAPTLVTAALVGPTNIVLNWVDNANNETGYTVQRANDAAFLITPVTTTLPAGSITYTDTTALAGTAYYYRVASSNGLGLSKYVTATPKPITTRAALTIPAATVLKAAKVNAAYTTTLTATGGLAPYTWSASGLPAGVTIAPATGIISAVAFPSVNPAVLLSSVPVTVTVTDSLGSSYTTPVPLTIAVTEVKPAVPTLLTAVAASATQVNLTWTASSNASGYTVQRTSTAVAAAGAKKATATTVTFVVPAGAVAYSDTTAVTKTAYTYKVNATNIVGASAFTAAVAVTTP